MHLNALYDLKTRLYMDAVVQKRREANENAALVQMVDRSNIAGPAIVIADRGYEACKGRFSAWVSIHPVGASKSMQNFFCNLCAYTQ